MLLIIFNLLPKFIKKNNTPTVATTTVDQHEPSTVYVLSVTELWFSVFTVKILKFKTITIDSRRTTDGPFPIKDVRCNAPLIRISIRGLEACGNGGRWRHGDLE